MNEQQINTFLQQARKTSDWLYSQHFDKSASYVLSMSSQIAVKALASSEKRKPIVCGCGNKLTHGVAIRFYQENGHCYDCDFGYSNMLSDFYHEAKPEFLPYESN